MFTSPAYLLIGETGEFKLPGGRTVYEGVLFNAETARGDRVRLARVTSVVIDGQPYLHQINRWVNWTQDIEVHKLDEDDWRPCATCLGRCYWVDDQWVCDACGDEFAPDTDTYAIEEQS